MSATSPLRNRLPNVAPRVAQAALERARLTVVPRRRTRAPRVPFVTFVSVILLGGVIGLLMFNTSMQQASFRETALRKQATDLGAQQEALEMDLQELNDPAHVARAAERLGMVMPTTGAGVLKLGSGITGDPQPATGEDRLPLQQPGPKRPASLDPPPVKQKVKATTDGVPATVQ
ncbi:hypothetical protein [Nocardioides nitrophenolicus]|uniref:hypothetical protein n=1 Tax=Nocardioides nitrophenolicus TaxID=60489 RepID=UPI00195EE0D6|nr:hypothetical protein [Nocardioides nitrophenolicus]MBM7515331.1 hypothetical protein [Nocardioides nitrophenolicus]